MRFSSRFLTFLFVNFSFCLVTSICGLYTGVNCIYNPNRYIPESLKWSKRLSAKVGDQSVGGTLILGGQEYYITAKESDLLLKKLRLMKDVNVHVPFPHEKFFTMAAKVYILWTCVIPLTFAKYTAKLLVKMFRWIPMFKTLEKKTSKVIEEIFQILRLNDLLFLEEYW
jgi:hypothetical protein